MDLTSPTGYYDNNFALRLAAACQLAYDLFGNPAAPPPAGCQINATFTGTLFGNSELLGYTMSSAADAIVAFRGSDSLLDWLDDSAYAEMDYPFVARAGLTHEGFTRVYQSLRDQVLASLKNLPQRPLFITGHSLGGAVATLAALDIAANSLFSAPVIYTIASPHVGDPDFADAFDATMVKGPNSSWRILNTFDVVPLRP